MSSFLNKSKIPDHYVSMARKLIVPEAVNSTNSLAKKQDRMVTPVPEIEVVPTPPKPGGYENKMSRKDGNNTFPEEKSKTHPQNDAQPRSRTGWSPKCLRKRKFQRSLSQEKT